MISGSMLKERFATPEAALVGSSKASIGYVSVLPSPTSRTTSPFSIFWTVPVVPSIAVTEAPGRGDTEVLWTGVDERKVKVDIFADAEEDEE